MPTEMVRAATARRSINSSSPLEPQVSRAEWSAIALCTVLGLMLRAWRLDYQSFWFDEILTILSSEQSLMDILVRPPVDPNIPPLYYSLMHFVLPLGRSEEVLRLPSLIFGTLSIPVLYLVARCLTGQGVALMAAILLAVSPFHVWYSQEARPYALLILLALVAFCLLQHLVERPMSRTLAASAAVFTAGAFWSHTIAVPFLAVLAVYVLVTTRAELWRFWAVFGAIVLLLMAPAIYRLLVVAPNVSANAHYQFHPAHLAYTLWAFGTGYSLGPNLIELRVEGMRSVTRNLYVLAPTLVLFAAFLVTAAVHLWRTSRRVFWVLGAWLILPIAFAVLGGIITTHPFNVRYAITAFPAFVVLLAIGISRLPGSRGRLAGLAAVLFISTVSLKNYYADPRYHREDTRGAVQWLNRHALHGDLVLASAPYMTPVLRHYQLRSDLSVQAYPLRRQEAGPPREAQMKSNLGARFVTREQVHVDLAELLRRRQGLWVFLSRTFHSDPEGHILAYLEEHARPEAEFTGAGVRVAYYRASVGKGR